MNSDQFIEAWKKGVPVKVMAPKFNLSESSVSRHALKVLGLQSRRKAPDEERENSILEYYKSHSILETAKEFKCAKITVQRIAKKYKLVKREPRAYVQKTIEDDLGLIPQLAPRKEMEQRVELEQQTIRVIKHVPENFKAPTRGIWW